MLQTSTCGPVARAAILAISMTATAQGATPGEVDPTFGTNGRTVVGDNSRAIALLLPDGSLLVASQVAGTLMDLRHFDSEGQADTDFGIAGVVRHEFADSTDLMQSMARAPDGRVYFGGWTRKESNERGRLDLAVFAVDSQGAAVTNFGDGGLASFDLANPNNVGEFDSARALVVMSDGRLLAAGFSAGNYYDYPDATRLPQLLRLNTDGSLDQKVDFGHGTNVCSGIAGLLVRADGSLLVGDDTGIYALLGDSALQTFGVDGAVPNEHWYAYDGCPGLQSFAAEQGGELLIVSAVNLQDGQLGIELGRLTENGTEIEELARAIPVPLASLVRNDARFADSSISLPFGMARPMHSVADDRLYLLFGFFWDNRPSSEDSGIGWAIARFAADGTLDTGWGGGGVTVLEKSGAGYWDTVPTLLEPLLDGRVVALSANGVLTRLIGGQREGHGAINIDAGRDVDEEHMQVSIQVTRTGGSAGAVSVDYSTALTTGAGSATGDADFTTISGHLDWADGDTSPREIVITILEDALEEDLEYFAVDIRAPTGGAVLLSTRALLGINDDADPTTPPPLPPPPPPDETSGGGAIDGFTLILLLSLIVLNVAQPVRNHFLLMNRRCAFRVERRNLAPRSKCGGLIHARIESGTAGGTRAHGTLADHAVVRCLDTQCSRFSRGQSA